MSNFYFDKKQLLLQNQQSGLYFAPDELLQVAHAADASEELVNNFFKLSSSLWLKNRYDIRTSKDLEHHELLDGPFAQVVKYEGWKKGLSLKSSSFSLYKICLQDRAILSAVYEKGLGLEPLLFYILTHELVHVVRFSQFEKRYEHKGESRVTLEEERKVHLLTYYILNSVSVKGLEQVFEFYRDWIKEPAPCARVKKMDNLS